MDSQYFSERLKTNRDRAQHDQVIGFSNAMLHAGDETLAQTLGQYMDMDYILRYMAVDFSIGNWDGITTYYCSDLAHCGNHNYYIYQEASRPFFWLIPWDLEASFFVDHWLGDIEPWDNLNVTCDARADLEGIGMFILPAGCDPTIRAIALSDRSRYENLLAEILKNHLSQAQIMTRMTPLIELITPSITSDPDMSYGSWIMTLFWQLDEFGDLRARIENEIRGTAAWKAWQLDEVDLDAEVDVPWAQVPVELSAQCQALSDLVGNTCGVDLVSLMQIQLACLSYEQLFIQE